MSRYRPPRRAGTPLITAAGAARLREELDELWLRKRPAVTQAVSEAAALGDRSENAEYIYGKKKLREIDRRIRFLSTRLDELKVVENGERSEATKVFFGAWVRVEDEEGNEKVYRIVGPDEHDMDPRYVSMDGPLGRALLGKRLDDEVLVRRPKGDIDVVIVEIGYEPLD